MVLKEFIFVIRKPDGKEYEQEVPARSEEDAERRLKNVLDVFFPDEKIVAYKGWHH